MLHTALFFFEEFRFAVADFCYTFGVRSDIGRARESHIANRK